MAIALASLPAFRARLRVLWRHWRYLESRQARRAAAPRWPGSRRPLRYAGLWQAQIRARLSLRPDAQYRERCRSLEARIRIPLLAADATGMSGVLASGWKLVAALFCAGLLLLLGRFAAASRRACETCRWSCPLGARAQDQAEAEDHHHGTGRAVDPAPRPAIGRLRQARREQQRDEREPPALIRRADEKR